MKVNLHIIRIYSIYYKDEHFRIVRAGDWTSSKPARIARDGH